MDDDDETGVTPTLLLEIEVGTCFNTHLTPLKLFKLFTLISDVGSELFSSSSFFKPENFMRGQANSIWLDDDGFIDIMVGCINEGAVIVAELLPNDSGADVLMVYILGIFVTVTFGPIVHSVVVWISLFVSVWRRHRIKYVICAKFTMLSRWVFNYWKTIYSLNRAK